MLALSVQTLLQKKYSRNQLIEGISQQAMNLGLQIIIQVQLDLAAIIMAFLQRPFYHRLMRGISMANKVIVKHINNVSLADLTMD